MKNLLLQCYSGNLVLGQTERDAVNSTNITTHCGAAQNLKAKVEVAIAILLLQQQQYFEVTQIPNWPVAANRTNHSYIKERSVKIKVAFQLLAFIDRPSDNFCKRAH